MGIRIGYLDWGLEIRIGIGDLGLSFWCLYQGLGIGIKNSGSAFGLRVGDRD